MPVGVQIPTARSMILQCYRGPVSQPTRHRSVVQRITLEQRLKLGTVETVTATAEIKYIIDARVIRYKISLVPNNTDGLPFVQNRKMNVEK